MKILFIIPARGGSKRLPGKNIKPLMGKPLLAYSIEFALSFMHGDNTVIVSTDEEQIKKTALQYGAQVMDRPESLSGDFVPTLEVMQQVVSHFVDVDWVVLLQPTNPLRPENLLKEAFQILASGSYDSLMTVTEHIQKLGKIQNNTFIPYNYTFGQRSQDMEPLYFENGLLYISTPKLLIQGKILGDKAFPMIINHPFAHVDIDTIEDFEYATYLLNKHKTVR